MSLLVGSPKQFTDAMIAAALAASVEHTRHAASLLGCSTVTVWKFRKRRGDVLIGDKTPMFTDAQISKALDAAKGSRTRAAAALGCSTTTVSACASRIGYPIPTRAEVGQARAGVMAAFDRYVATHPIPQRAVVLPKRAPAPFSWAPDDVEHLRTLVGVRPRLSNAEIARDFGVTKDEVERALRRFGVTRQGAAPATTRMRGCLNCERPFLSEGPGNRRCMQCRSESAGMVA